MSDSPRTPLRTRLTEHVSKLTRGSRTPNSTSHLRTRRHILSFFNRAGYEAEEFEFGGSGFVGFNIFTRPVPDPIGQPLLIVGAHYDSVTNSPGADDNATGVAALLTLAEHFGAQLRENHDWKGCLQFAAYDLEEYGILGSWAHSKEMQLNGYPIRGMIALEMLGYTDHRPGSQRLPQHLAGIYPVVGDFIGLCANESSRSLLQPVEQGMRSIEGLPVQSLVVPERGEAIPEVRLSDHSSFWDAGYPALMITDTSFFRNPHYHQTTDTVETLDLEFLERVTRGLIAAVERILSS
jgi:Zn-dependent M28 family amino/carboxypeptidase